MSAQDDFETELLGLLFTNVLVDNVGDAAGLPVTVGEGFWEVSLHTALPAETTNDQTTSEAAYTGYSTSGRQPVARNITDWTVAANLVDNDLVITYTVSTSGPESITFFGLGFAHTAAGDLKMTGAVSPTLVVNNGVTPEFAAGALDVTLE